MFNERKFIEAVHRVWWEEGRKQSGKKLVEWMVRLVETIYNQPVNPLYDLANWSVPARATG